DKAVTANSTVAESDLVRVCRWKICRLGCSCHVNVTRGIHGDRTGRIGPTASEESGIEYGTTGVQLRDENIVASAQCRLESVHCRELARPGCSGNVNGSGRVHGNSATHIATFATEKSRIH